MELERELRLSNVCFQYQGAAAPAVQSIDIQVARNERIALVGSTGSGKTTLVDIIVGLLLPQDGDLTVDGTPIRPDNVAAWLQIIAYVPQDVFLYDDTIARNIAFGVGEGALDRERIREAARIAQIDRSAQRALQIKLVERLGQIAEGKPVVTTGQSATGTGDADHRYTGWRHLAGTCRLAGHRAGNCHVQR